MEGTSTQPQRTEAAYLHQMGSHGSLSGEDQGSKRGRTPNQMLFK